MVNRAWVPRSLGAFNRKVGAPLLSLHPQYSSLGLGRPRLHVPNELTNVRILPLSFYHVPFRETSAVTVATVKPKLSNERDTSGLHSVDPCRQNALRLYDGRLGGEPGPCSPTTPSIRTARGPRGQEIKRRTTELDHILWGSGESEGSLRHGVKRKSVLFHQVWGHLC
jgi:hypothetical protein